MPHHQAQTGVLGPGRRLGANPLQKGDPIVSTPKGPSSYPQAQTGPPSDRAYLIRCWQETDIPIPGTVRWRFSVEEVLHERTRRGFSDLASLLDYLRTELGSKSEAGASCNNREGMTRTPLDEIG